ncbi:MAG: insulinase family protein, partial [Victivallales bacterium]|nr:insulinase family protein [Victivallales bacterium]
MFQFVSTTQFPERRLVARRYRHDCGLEVLSLEADDPENLFALCFRTEPTDSTGMPHVIEHSVLEGSRKYPVKDPFVCMLKTSVATFINAMTYPDRTIYPCTTCCPKDYFNLFEVYWDAVFHPRLNRETFGQEGWHYEVSGSARRPVLKYNGIVYNEMSGYYSDPMTVLGRTVEETLFPEAPVRHDSGGDPDRIPRLTYAKFRKFHQEHYNPAVTRVVLYGDIPTAEKLAFIESHLQEMKPSRVSASPAVFPPVTGASMRPRVVRRSYVPDAASARSRKGICAMAWRLDCDRDPEIDLGLQLLMAVLLGNAGAPLARALKESRLGAAMLNSGYDNETRYTSFQVGLRGVREQDCPRMEELILSTLEKLVRDGLSAEQVESAVTAFQVENQNIGPMYLIELLDDIMASWNYSDDPFVFLRMSEALPRIQETLRRRPRYFEELIQKWLLDNPARVRIDLLPDATLREKRARAQAERLARTLARWSPEQVRRARDFAAKLQRNAVTPDSPEALATLPRLTRDDLPAKLKPLPLSDGVFANGLSWKRGEVFHNGISRVKLLADASSVPPEQAIPMNILLNLLPQLGNATQTYDRCVAEYARLGVNFSLRFTETSLRESPKYLRLFELSCDGLDRSFSVGLELFRRQLDTVVFTERRHLVELLRASAMRAAAALSTHANLSRCQARACAGLTLSGELAEELNGFTGFLHLQQLGRLTESQLDDFCGQLQACAQTLRELPLVVCGYVGSDEGLAAVEQFAGTFAVAQTAGAFIPWESPSVELAPAIGRREFCAVNAQVSNCARILRAPHFSDPDSTPLAVLGQLLSVGYLWDEVRAKGGAYGVGFAYQPFNRHACLHSSEDPQPANTYRVFDEVADVVATHRFTSEEVGQAVLSTAGAFLRAARPAE